jgi:hypothetical protein
MNFKIISTLICLVLIIQTSILNAQTGKIKNVELGMSGSDPNLLDAKYNIDLAYNHESTKNMASMWGWRGVVYAMISTSNDNEVKSLNEDNSAALISGQSFVTYFSFPVNEQKKYSALDFSQAYVVSAIIECYNHGVAASMDKGNFKTVKQYMDIVESLLPYDTEQKLKGQISKEKSLYITWQSAYNDSLIDQEIIYLQKLIDVPNYMNAYVFIRMSEIYLNQKNYEKAVSYLEAGRVKIPSKSSDFLNQQINIEIERNNIESLIVKFTEGIQNDPENKEYYFSRGVAYHQLKIEDRDKQEKAIKIGETPSRDKYYYIQALKDYSQALKLDPGYTDALNNEAVLLLDSADYIYKQRTRVSTSEYSRYDKLSINLYQQVVLKLVAIYEMNYKKDQDLVELLKSIKSIYAKLNDEDNRMKYDQLYKQEKKKLE